MLRFLFIACLLTTLNACGKKANPVAEKIDPPQSQISIIEGKA